MEARTKCTMQLGESNTQSSAQVVMKTTSLEPENHASLPAFVAALYTAHDLQCSFFVHTSIIMSLRHILCYAFFFQYRSVIPG